MSERVIRKVFARDDGYVDDVLALIVCNDTDAPIPVTVRAFNYTDAVAANVQHQAVREDVTWAPSWLRYDDVPGQVAYHVTPRLRTLEPGQYHSIALRVTRGGCLTRSGDQVVFQDPTIDYAPSGVTTPIGCTLVFPERHIRTEVTSENAATTSRTATWRRGPSNVTSCSATYGRARLSVAPRAIDNAIAELHRLVAAVLCHDWISLTEYERLVSGVLCSLSFGLTDDDFRAMPWNERLRIIEAQIDVCENARSQIVTRALGMTVGTEQDLAEHASRLLAQYTPDQRFLPADLWEALESLSRYLLEQRRLPNAWPEGVKESDLHSNLRNFLSGRVHVESEVQSSRGRIDFLLGETPVELKCRDLGPKRDVSAHLQQAAEYATSRGRNAACLLILDTTPPFDFHEPLPTADVTAHAVASAPATGHAPATCVVLFVIRARTKSPSKLGLKRPKKRVKRARAKGA